MGFAGFSNIPRNRIPPPPLFIVIKSCRKLRFEAFDIIGYEAILEFSSFKASQNALCVTKLSFLYCSTITLVLSSTTNFAMSFPIRLNCILFRTLFALPLLLTMLTKIMLLNSGKISKSSRRIMMNTTYLRTNINLLLHNFKLVSLLKLPW
ncbi:hypothetical protein Hanom_Chr13g01241821 [Helianthus anomalus]